MVVLLSSMGLQGVRAWVAVWDGAAYAHVAAAAPDGRTLAFCQTDPTMYNDPTIGDHVQRPLGLLRVTQQLLAAAGYCVRPEYGVFRPSSLLAEKKEGSCLCFAEYAPGGVHERRCLQEGSHTAWNDRAEARAQVITVPNWEWHALSAAAPAKDAATYKAQRDAKRAAYLIRLLNEAGIEGIEAGAVEVEQGAGEEEASADREAGAGDQ